MPHLTFEYTKNLQEESLDLPTLLLRANQLLIGFDGVYPIGGIRSRAVCLEHYCVADGSNARDAFVHACLKMGTGRTEAQKQATGDALFALMQQHFAEVFTHRDCALSLEIMEFSEAGTWKKNSIHQRYKKEASSRSS